MKTALYIIYFLTFSFAPFAGAKVTSLKYFGYWDCTGCQYDIDNVIANQRDHVNTTSVMSVAEYPAGSKNGVFIDYWESLSKARKANQKIVIGWPFFDDIDVDRTVAASRLIAWLNIIKPYEREIVAVNVADEPDCNHNATFLSWDEASCKRMRLKLEANISALKSILPSTPAWVNYTSAFVYGIERNFEGYRLPMNVDWVSLDCYVPTHTCFAGTSLETLTRALERNLRSDQKIVLVPPAFQGQEIPGHYLTPQIIVGLAEEYYQLALRHPQVIAIFPFIWENSNGKIGASNVPEIRAKYSEIGKKILNENRKTVADYDRDGRSDYAIFRPSSGYHFTKSSLTGAQAAYYWGLSSDIPLSGDYDGDGIPDIAVYRPSNGTFYVIQSFDGKKISRQWGTYGDIPVVGDYDGDRRSDFAFYRPSMRNLFVIYSSNDQTAAFEIGNTSSTPLGGDYDGDGKTDPATYTQLTGMFEMRLSSTGTIVSRPWGGPGDIPLVGDYDGDNKTDLAFYRPSWGHTFIIRSMTNTTAAYHWGLSTDIPEPGDYDGDGLTDIAVFRPSDGVQYVYRLGLGLSPIYSTWGQLGDRPLVVQSQFPN